MKNITLIMVLFCATQLVNAQETIPVSGGEATGAGGTVSYTIGQLIYTNPTTAAGSLNQGIQQSIEFVTLSNPEFTAVTLKALTYPNPTTDFIILALKDANLTGLSYTMYDLLGRLVNKGMEVNKVAILLVYDGTSTISTQFILKVVALLGITKVSL